LRKSSTRITLVLIGVAALAGCDSTDDVRRDVYKTREDCLADWGNRAQDCTPATEQRHAGRGYWYGPSYGYSSVSRVGGWSSSSGLHSRSIGSTSHGVSRGGFGSSGRSSAG